MPTTVEGLFMETLGRVPDESVKWKTPAHCPEPGVYVVSYKRPICTADLSPEKIRAWIGHVPAMRIDGESPSEEAIMERLAGLIYPDETVLYIGQTSQPLQRRIQQFYIHTLGNRSPHRGGHWLKTLSIIEDLTVSWCTTNRPIDIERKMLEHYMGNVSRVSRERLHDSNALIPFANLLQPGARKQHGFTHQTL